VKNNGVKFFMFSKFWQCLLLILATYNVSFASNAILKDIIVTTSHKELLVYFTVEGCFTRKMEEAILNGIPVTFTFDIVLEERKTFWPDKKIVDFKIYHTIKYDQLKGVFVIERSEKLGEITSRDFIWAKKLMAEVETAVAPLSSLKKGHKYKLSLKAKLKKVKLPLYLHYIFFFTSMWNFETDWYKVNFVY